MTDDVTPKKGDALTKMMAQNAANFEAQEVASVATVGYVLGVWIIMLAGFAYWTGYHIREPMDRAEGIILSIALTALTGLSVLGLSALTAQLKNNAIKLLVILMASSILGGFFINLLSANPSWGVGISQAIWAMMLLGKLYPGISSIAELNAKNIANGTPPSVDGIVSKLIYGLAILLIGINILLVFYTSL